MANENTEAEALLDLISEGPGRGSPSLADRLAVVRDFCVRSPQQAERFYGAAIKRLTSQRAGLDEARGHLGEMKN
ncbi:MAG: hypothetical protein K8I02_12440, partial [Candidatus Methylomirabilis sp.]|nr:hypothetical protein [Deltaproteobacteria bacterium]